MSPERILIYNFSTGDPSKIRLESINSKIKAKDKLKFYQAPEVLVGQSESEASLIWSLGLIIDELFLGRTFYNKFADILGPKSTEFLR